MCGICGEIRFDDSAVDSEALARMVAVLERRGPDAGGMVIRERIGLGHRRLSIIDLSSQAEQPMVDATLGLSIVFNGAIYNYPELRSVLESKGHRFFSHSDTEVILKAYAEWGSDCVRRLNGMFAFAIAERDSGRVFLARDRLGIKPLYLSESAGVLRFASSLQALVAAGDVDLAIDPVGLHHYMTLHAVVPAPYTVLKQIRKLPPATTWTIERDGRRRSECYWEVDFATPAQERDLPFEAWQERALHGLREAVRRRTVADVPVGGCHR